MVTGRVNTCFGAVGDRKSSFIFSVTLMVELYKNYSTICVLTEKDVNDDLTRRSRSAIAVISDI